MKVSNIAPFGVRMPPDLKKRLEASAKKNSRSLNAEVVHWLQKAMDEQDALHSNGIARHLPMHITDSNIDGYREGDDFNSVVLDKFKVLIDELEKSFHKK